MVSIKREYFKKRFFVVARDDKGRFVTYKRWSHQFSTPKARSIFKLSGTFKEKVKRVKLKNVVEVSDFSKKPTRPVGLSQYFVRARDKNTGKIIITARSLQYPKNVPKQKIIDEAWDNFYYRFSEFIDPEQYDRDIGEFHFNTMRDKVNIEEGWIHYKSIR